MCQTHSTRTARSPYRSNSTTRSIPRCLWRIEDRLRRWNWWLSDEFTDLLIILNLILNGHLRQERPEHKTRFLGQYTRFRYRYISKGLGGGRIWQLFSRGGPLKVAQKTLRPAHATRSTHLGWSTHLETPPPAHPLHVFSASSRGPH